MLNEKQAERPRPRDKKRDSPLFCTMRLSTRSFIGQWQQFFRVMALALMSLQFTFAQMPLNEQTLEALGTKSSDDEEKFADDWVNTEVEKWGRVATSAKLAAIVAENPQLKTYDRLIRKIGRRVEPEFTQAVLAQIDLASDPLVRGGLLQLLRDAAPETAASIAKMLSDTRPGEDLVAESKRLPKLRESIANGAEAFRVCDIAFNLMHEIGAAKNTKALKLTRSQSIEARDRQIHLASGAASENKPDDINLAPPSTIVSTPSQSQKQDSGSEPKTPTPNQEPTSSTPWSIIVVLIVAAIGLLLLVLKRRS
jgi:hypothetical protein